MKRTILTPEQAAWLDETILRNRARFGGLRMEDDGKSDDGKKADDDGKSDDGKKADDELGAGGKRALDAEREARKALKTELDELKSGLKQAIGLKDDAEQDDDKNLLVSLQQQIQGMQRDAAVLTLANEHKITDKDDLALLKSAKDDEAMKKLAERLAPTEEEPGTKPRRPRPDRSQGGGDGNQSSRTGSVAEVMAERRAAREGKTK